MKNSSHKPADHIIFVLPWRHLSHNQPINCCTYTNEMTGGRDDIFHPRTHALHKAFAHALETCQTVACIPTQQSKLTATAPSCGNMCRNIADKCSRPIARQTSWTSAICILEARTKEMQEDIAAVGQKGESLRMLSSETLGRILLACSGNNSCPWPSCCESSTSMCCSVFFFNK